MGPFVVTTRTTSSDPSDHPGQRHTQSHSRSRREDQQSRELADQQRGIEESREETQQEERVLINIPPEQLTSREAERLVNLFGRLYQESLFENLSSTDRRRLQALRDAAHNIPTRVMRNQSDEVLALYNIANLGWLREYAEDHPYDQNVRAVMDRMQERVHEHYKEGRNPLRVPEGRRQQPDSGHVYRSNSNRDQYRPERRDSTPRPRQEIREPIVPPPTRREEEAVEQEEQRLINIPPERLSEDDAIGMVRMYGRLYRAGLESGDDQNLFSQTDASRLRAMQRAVHHIPNETMEDVPADFKELYHMASMAEYREMANEHPDQEESFGRQQPEVHRSDSRDRRRYDSRGRYRPERQNTGRQQPESREPSRPQRQESRRQPSRTGRPDRAEMQASWGRREEQMRLESQQQEGQRQEPRHEGSIQQETRPSSQRNDGRQEDNKSPRNEGRRPDDNTSSIRDDRRHEENRPSRPEPPRRQPETRRGRPRLPGRAGAVQSLLQPQSLSSLPRDSPECTICGDAFANASPEDPPVNLPCGHIYCEGCISHWLTEPHNNTCPICRADFARQINGGRAPSPSGRAHDRNAMTIEEALDPADLRAARDAQDLADEMANMDMGLAPHGPGSYDPYGGRFDPYGGSGRGIVPGWY
jgi:hypothetical protein